MFYSATLLLYHEPCSASSFEKFRNLWEYSRKKKRLILKNRWTLIKVSLIGDIENEQFIILTYSDIYNDIVENSNN